MSQSTAEIWSSAGMAANYSVMEAVVAMPAMKMLEDSKVFEASKTDQLNILDNACGTGVVSELIYGKLAKDSFTLVATDIAQPMVNIIKAKIEKNGWDNATAHLADMQDLSMLKDGTFTHVFTNVSINFPDDGKKVLEELNRILKPGGINGFTTWINLGWIPTVQEAFKKIPNARPFPSMGKLLVQKAEPRNQWDDDKWIKEQLLATGYENISINVHSVDHNITKEECVKVMGGPMMFGVMGFFGYTKEEVAEIGPKVGPALEEYLTETNQKEIMMPMSAWVTVASKKA